MNTSLGLAEPVTNYEVGPNFLVSLEKKKCLSVRNSIPRTCCLRAQNLPMETSDPLKKLNYIGLLCVWVVGDTCHVVEIRGPLSGSLLTP